MLPNPGSSGKGGTSALLSKAHRNWIQQVQAPSHRDIPRDFPEPGSAAEEDMFLQNQRANFPNASGPSVSLESGSSGSPSLGSDVAMAPPELTSLVGQFQNIEGLGVELDSPDCVKRKKKRGQRSLVGEKGGKGLRHFSLKVCKKVESKGRTTYNEVADELVAEFVNPDNHIIDPDQQQYDEKNIRRRVYDALNVLMAMDIIAKEKKEIQWKGLPSNSFTSIEELKSERMRVQSRIENKVAYLRELEEQFLGIQELIQRNQNVYHGTGCVPDKRVALPFILVQTRPHATVEVEISEDMQLVHFDFNSSPFELHDDAYVVKSMKSSGHLNISEPDLIDREKDGQDCATPSNYVNLYSSSHSPTSMSAPYSSPYVERLPLSPPVPGILKNRAKQDHMTQFL